MPADDVRHMAVCDEDAILGVLPLLGGPFEDIGSLSKIERVFRAYVLYDDIEFTATPEPYVHEMTDSLYEEGKRRRKGLDAVSEPLGLVEVSTEELADRCSKALGGVDAADLLGAEAHREICGWEDSLLTGYENPAENVQRMEAHIGGLFGVVHQGGSAIVEGELERQLISSTLVCPIRFLSGLDHEWKDYVRRLDAGDIGLVVPPITAIVLARASTREAIPKALRELHEEWSRARSRLWTALEEFQSARTLKEANEARKSLERASALMMPDADFPRLMTFQNFWDLVVAVVQGAVSGVATGEDPVAGALGEGVGWLADLVTREFGNRDIHFRRGAFDLSREVHTELANVPRIPELLSSVLSDAERQAIGL